MSAPRALRTALHAAVLSLFIPFFLLVAVPAGRLRRRARPRILWGTTPIANLRNSVAADRLAGFESESVVYRPYRPGDVAAFDHAYLLRAPLLRQLVPYAALMRAALRHDIFCLYFDGGLLAPTPFWRVELPLLRAAGKRILVWPYGGDARLASVTRARDGWHAYSEIAPGAEDRDDADVRAHLEAFGRWADVVCGCADVVEELPRVDDVLPYPFDTSRWLPVEPDGDDVVRIVHAPNHRHYKGTEHVLAAVEELREEGLAVELELVEGMESDVARRVYERADIAVDQLLIGAYALFSIECMALGKPVVCHLSGRFRPYHPELDGCPIVDATPDTILEVLRALVQDPERRRELGARGPAYVEAVHSLAAFAARTAPIYERLWRSDRKRLSAADRVDASD